MAKREVWSVRWDKSSRWWHVVDHLRNVIYSYRVKAVAVSTAASECRGVWEGGGNLAQLRVFNKNGRIAFERTYGKDPRRTKG